MPPIESPLNAAHQHAANAEDFLAQGLLMPAAEEHYKAAEAFEAALQAAAEDHTKRTLRMLYNEHSKAGKELQRKIAKLREENKDPSLPQRAPSRSVVPSASVSAVSSSLATPQTTPSPPPQPGTARLSDSQQMVDESFMLLGQKSETSDAFNHFWKITEGMLDYLSQPVAFATAPLAPPENRPSSSRRREGSGGSDTDAEDTLTKTFNRGLDFVKAAGTRMLVRHDSSTNISDSDSGKPGISTFPPKPIAKPILDDWEDDLEDCDEAMADSFLVIPSKSDQSIVSLKKENVLIKAQLEEERKKLAVAEQLLKQRQEQGQHLRESIMLARKEAHRAMTSSMALRPPTAPSAPPLPPVSAPTPLAPVAPLDLVTLANINVPPPPLLPTTRSPGPGRDRNDAQLVRRVRELEDELRSVRADNEKQRAIIVKFRERWEKLKESSKRKKEARAAVHTSVANERIEEDPEAEAAAEKEEDIRPRKHTEGPIAV